VLRLHLGRGVATRLRWGIVPGLHIRLAEDHVETVAHQVESGGDEEHNAPLLGIVLENRLKYTF